MVGVTMFDDSEIDDFTAWAERERSEQERAEQVIAEENVPGSLPYLRLWSQFVATITPFSEVNLDPQDKANFPHLILRH